MKDNFSPKWRNLKFVEISVWRKVGGLFFIVCLFYFPSLRGEQTRCRVHAFLHMPPLSFACRAESMRNFSFALVVVEELLRPRCHHRHQQS